MKLTKKEKNIIICSLAVICMSLYIFNKRDIIIEKLANNKLFSKSYTTESREKKLEREIGRKLRSETLIGLIKELSIEKLEVANNILNSDELIEVLNDKNKEKYDSKRYLSGDLSYEEAIFNYRVSKSFSELASLSEKIKNYLKGSFSNYNYEEIVTNEGKIPELIGAKNKFIKLTSNNFLSFLKVKLIR